MKENNNIKVYIAGPYTKPDPCENTYKTIQVANYLLDRGFIPFVPHLFHFWHTMSPRPYQDWTKMDFAWLPCCDALLLLPGESPGAQAEVEVAKELNIPIFNNAVDVIAFFDRSEVEDED